MNITDIMDIIQDGDIIRCKIPHVNSYGLARYNQQTGKLFDDFGNQYDSFSNFASRVRGHQTNGLLACQIDRDGQWVKIDDIRQLIKNQRKLSAELKDLRQDTSLLMLPVEKLLNKKKTHDKLQQKADNIRKQRRKFNKKAYTYHTRFAISSKSTQLKTEHQNSGIDHKDCVNDETYYSCESDSEIDTNKNLIRIPKDGNCFWRSCGIKLNKDHLQIRKECCQYLLKNQYLYNDFCLNKTDIENLMNSGVWNNDAMDLMMQAVSNIYNVVININKGQYVFKPPTTKTNTFDNEIIYLKLHNEHYDLYV
jgi:hypothetical protein